jgi:histone acetyltransferase
MPGEQVQGHGTRLMNALKSYAQAQGVTDLVTYADVAAVGYFSKQGFYPCEKSSLPSAWDGHIKDYDGAYLKRCRVYPNVDYSTLPQYVNQAKSKIWAELMVSLKPLRRQGLPQRPARIEDIPGVNLAQPIKSLEAQISDILESAFAHKSSWPFQQPVDIKEAPDYSDVVQCPTDLSTMRKRNAQRGFRTAESFKLELKLMFDNCYLYNGQSSIYAREAQALEKLVMPRVERLCRREEEDREEASKRDSVKKRKN